MSPLFSIFSSKNTTQPFPDSDLIKLLKKTAIEHNITIFQDLTLYHRDQSIFVPLMLLDMKHGLFLFEYKTWSYSELSGSYIEVSTNQHQAPNNLYFSKIQNFIVQKLSEIQNQDSMEISKFLLLEKLSIKEYEKLETNIKTMLPQKKLIFSDSTQAEILNSFQQTAILGFNAPTTEELTAGLLTQYLIIDTHAKHLATLEQRRFIDSTIENHQTLSAESYSGKSSSLVLKALQEKLKKSTYHPIIITPTKVACERLKQQLLNTIEYSFLSIDVTSIEILTPIELLNKHLKKLKKELLEDTLIIDHILMEKNVNLADLILCDDSDLLTREFINYLIHIQKNAGLLLVTKEALFQEQQIFLKSFKPLEKKFIFKQNNPYPQALQIIKNLLEENDAKDILIICSNTTKEHLNADLSYYINHKTSLLSSSTTMQDHKLKNLTLASYNRINAIHYKFVILLDICLASIQDLIYASNLATDSIYYLYDDDACELITILKDKFETKTE